MFEFLLISLLFAHLNLGALLLGRRSQQPVLQPVTIEVQQQIQQRKVVFKRKHQPVSQQLFQFIIKLNRWPRLITPPLPSRAPPTS